MWMGDLSITKLFYKKKKKVDVFGIWEYYGVGEGLRFSVAFPPPSSNADRHQVE